MAASGSDGSLRFDTAINIDGSAGLNRIIRVGSSLIVKLSYPSLNDRFFIFAIRLYLLVIN